MEFSKLEDEMIETPTQKTQRTWLDIKALRKRFYTEKAILAVDEYALILFPLSFGLFNVLYWLTIANDSESTFTNSWQNTGKCTWLQIAFIKQGPATQATTHVVVRLCPSARADEKAVVYADINTAYPRQHETLVAISFGWKPKKCKTYTTDTLN